jgi:predicted DNA-binding protein (UPF0251 family)
VTSGLRTTPEVEAEIIRLYQEPEVSVAEIRAKTGVSGSVICRVIHEAGIAPRHGGKRSPGKLYAAITDACGAGMTREQAAAAFGVPQATVMQALRRAERPPGMLTAAQAAAVIGADTRTVHGLYRAGLIRAGRPRPDAHLWYVAEDAAALAALRARLAGAGESGWPR